MIPYFDAHCDTVTAWDSIEENSGELDARRLSAFAPSAQIFAICCVHDMAAGYARYLPELKRQIGASERLVLCLSPDDIRKAAAAGKTGAVIAVEGAEHFGCSVDGLRRAFEAGCGP